MSLFAVVSIENILRLSETFKNSSDFLRENFLILFLGGLSFYAELLSPL